MKHLTSLKDSDLIKIAHYLMVLVVAYFILKVILFPALGLWTIAVVASLLSLGVSFLLFPLTYSFLYFLVMFLVVFTTHVYDAVSTRD